MMQTSSPIVAPPRTAVDPAVEAQVQRVYAEAIHAVQTVLAGAGGRTARLLIEELEHTDWGRELAGLAADLVFSPTSDAGDAISGDPNVRRTLLVALDAQGQRAFTLHGPGWNARSLLPAALQWARAVGAPVAWTRSGRPLGAWDGRYALATPFQGPALSASAHALTSVGWQVTPQGQGFVASRAVTQRDWASLIVLAIVGLLVFPLMVLLFAWMAVMRLTTGAWPRDPRSLSPWHKAEDRVVIECGPGSLRVVRTRDGQSVLDRVYDRNALQALWVEPASAGRHERLVLIERDRCAEVPVILRGEIERSSDPHAQTASRCAQAIVAVWSQG
jgi:hypothetical protein